MAAMQCIALSGQLTPITNEFVKAAGSGDSAALAKTYISNFSRRGQISSKNNWRNQRLAMIPRKTQSK